MSDDDGLMTNRYVTIIEINHPPIGSKLRVQNFMKVTDYKIVVDYRL